MANGLLFQRVSYFLFSFLIALKQSFRAFTCLYIKHKASFNPDRHSFGMQKIWLDRPKLAGSEAYKVVHAQS